MSFREVWGSGDNELKDALKEELIQDLGYFVEPEYLYSNIIDKTKKGEKNLAFYYSKPSSSLNSISSTVAFLSLPLVSFDFNCAKISGRTFFLYSSISLSAIIP